MRKKPFKLGFIGGGIGSIAGYAHFAASRMDGLFEITAGAFSKDPVINRESAEFYKVETLFDDYNELIEYAKENLDAVSVLAPTPAHTEIVLKLINAGVSVICEKALSASVEDALAIKEALRKSRSFLAVTYNYSGFAMVRELKARIEAGELGRIYQVRVEMPQESFVRPPKSVKYPQKWRLTDPFIPTICLDLGVHLHHLAHFVAGFEAKSVYARMNSFSKYGVIDDVEMMMDGDDGMRGSFWMSKTALGNRNGLSIEVYGDKASGVWVQEEPERLRLSYANGDKKIVDRGSDTLVCAPKIYNRMTPGHPSGFVEAFANIYYDIAAELELFLEGKQTHAGVFDVDTAIDGLRLLHRAKESSEKKEWMEV